MLEIAPKMVRMSALREILAIKWMNSFATGAERRYPTIGNRPSDSNRSSYSGLGGVKSVNTISTYIHI
jgi:hypothetical protein